MDPTEPVEVYSTFSPADAQIIKVMLGGEGIDAEVTGGSQGGFIGATLEVTVMVRAEDADNARRLIRDHQKEAGRSAQSEEE